MSEASTRNEALEEAAKLADLYAETTFDICTDNILMDPLLRGAPATEENIARSRECSINSTIHSAGYHAATHIAEQIRLLKRL